MKKMTLIISNLGIYTLFTIILASLFFSCHSDEVPFSAEIVSGVENSTECDANNDTLEAIDSFFHYYNQMTKKMFDNSTNYTASQLESIMALLDVDTLSKAGLAYYMDLYFNVDANLIDEIIDRAETLNRHKNHAFGSLIPNL